MICQHGLVELCGYPDDWRYAKLNSSFNHTGYQINKGLRTSIGTFSFLVFCVSSTLNLTILVAVFNSSLRSHKTINHGQVGLINHLTINIVLADLIYSVALGFLSISLLIDKMVFDDCDSTTFMALIYFNSQFTSILSVTCIGMIRWLAVSSLPLMMARVKEFLVENITFRIKVPFKPKTSLIAPTRNDNESVSSKFSGKNYAVISAVMIASVWLFPLLFLSPFTSDISFNQQCNFRYRGLTWLPSGIVASQIF